MMKQANINNVKAALNVSAVAAENKKTYPAYPGLVGNSMANIQKELAHTIDDTTTGYQYKTLCTITHDVL